MNNNKEQLIMHCPVFFTGYGNAGWHFSKYLYTNDVDIALYPILAQKRDIVDLQNVEFYRPTDKEILQKILHKPINKESKCLKIFHQFDLLERIGTGEYIAYPFFELDTLSTLEKQHLSIPDKLIVSCQWAKDILLSNGIDRPIEIVNLGVDTDIFDYNFCTEKEDSDPFIFMNIGKWEIRKGHDVLLELFDNAFDKTDNVQLWIAGSSDKSCFTSKELEEWHSYYSSSKLKDKIRIIPRLPTQLDLAKIASNADCGIFMSRGEGWNLDLLEMMALNKPIITTNYSAHTEFCNKDNAFLIDITELEKAYDGKWFHGTGNWAKIGEKEKDQAVEYMRYVYKNKIRTNATGLKTAQNLSWNKVAKDMIRCIYKT
jgi:glycosyltransferase involved in cell wall biosynthesis